MDHLPLVVPSIKVAKQNVNASHLGQPADILHHDDDVLHAAELQGGQPVGRAQLEGTGSVHPPHNL